MSIALLFGWVAIRQPANRAPAACLAGLVCSTVALFIVAFPQLFAARTLIASVQGGWSSIPYETADLDIRMSSQDHAASVIATHPLTGLGAGAYSAGVYSAPLWIAVELGLLGLALWVWWLGLAFLFTLRRALAHRSTIWEVTALTALSAVGLGALFNPDVWTAQPGRLMLAMWIGLGAAGPASGRAKPMSDPVLRPAESLAATGRRVAVLVPVLRLVFASLAPLAQLFVLVAAVAYASGQPQILSPDDATQLAAHQIDREVTTGVIPEWKGADAGPSVAYYSLDGVVSAYVVEVRRGDREAGYVTVSARRLVNPVLEFGRGPAYHHLTNSQASGLSASALTVDRSRPLYLGPLSYYYPAVQSETGETYLMDMRTGQARPGPPAAPMRALPSARVLSADSLGPAAIGLPTYKLLTAPAYLQFWYGDCQVGCAPTASGIIMGYWADHDYPNLVAGGSYGDYRAAVIGLHDLMGTYCYGGSGWTYSNRITPAMLAYTGERGYTFGSEWLWSSTTATYDRFVSEVNSSRPIQVNLTNSWGDQHHPGYGNHSVTGVGYEYDPTNTDYRYMIIHDNWVTFERWLQYGVNYDSISFNTLLPMQRILLPIVLKN